MNSGLNHQNTDLPNGALAQEQVQQISTLLPIAVKCEEGTTTPSAVHIKSEIPELEHVENEIAFKVEPLITEEIEVKNEALTSSSYSTDEGHMTCTTEPNNSKFTCVIQAGTQELPLPYQKYFTQNSELKELNIQSPGKPPRQKTKTKLYSQGLVNKEKQFRCSMCNYRTLYKQHLKTHIMIHAEEKQFKCKQCDYATSRKSSLLNHLRSSRKHTVQLNSNDGDNVTKYKVHGTEQWLKTTQNNVKIFKCTYCEYVTCWQTTLKRHIAAHTEEKPFECKHCGYKCRTKDRLQKHISNHTKPFVCDDCGYKAPSNGYLQQHMRIHSSGQLLQCQLCDYKTPWNYSLNKHMKMHSEKELLKCEHCEYTTAQRRHLQGHMIAHATEMVFECFECKYKTSNKHTLKRHVKTHSGEKPFKCEACDYSAARNYHIQRHMKKVHMERYS